MKAKPFKASGALLHTSIECSCVSSRTFVNLLLVFDHGSDERTVSVTRLCRSTQPNVLKSTGGEIQFFNASQNKRGTTA